MGFLDEPKKTGAKSVSFDPNQGYTFGTKWEGVITEIGEDVQATKYGTDGELDFWSKSGQKRMTQPITIQALLNGQPPPKIDDEDDGRRTLWLKDGSGQREAFVLALKNHPQAREPEVGDYISMQWVSTTNPPAKDWVAEWRPRPASNFTGQATPAPQQPTQPQQQAPQAQQPNPVTGSWGQQVAAAPADAPF